jgi:transcriptional regulator with AAA-type ATPase domain/pSer/pThr/pTyr-binding forkhead associated (FHA) protein
MNSENKSNTRQPASPRAGVAAEKRSQPSNLTGLSTAEGHAHEKAPRSMLLEGQATMAIRPYSGFEKEEASIQPNLEVVSGTANQKIIYLGKEKVTIGRTAYNDLVLQDPKVSRSHAEVYFEEGHYVIEDLNSTNGVYVDDRLVNKIALKSGNRILLGDSLLVFTQPYPEISLTDKIAFIDKSELFNWLNQEAKALLARNMLVRFFPRDTFVVRPNAEIESMYFLYSGGIRVAEINEEGGERVIDQLGEGDFFGERALLAGEPGSYAMITNEDSYLLELRKDRLNELLQKKPELNQAFYRLVLNKLRSAQAKAGQDTTRRDNLKDIITSTDVTIVGEDRKIKEAVKKIESLAQEAKTALIVGPPGTGKKTFARYFHKVGPYPDYPYIEISVAELGESKTGATIFGVESDPDSTHFTGQIGYLEMIGKGTLAIAHVEQLDVHLQSKLVTYLKYGWFHRTHGQQSVNAKTNVIFIATGTETDVLEKLIPELRELLVGRVVSLPPLTQRLKDIPLLAEHYLKLFSRKNGKHVNELSREALEKLVSYAWPGNIKELENVLQRAVIVASDNVIIPGDLIFVLPSEKEIHKLNLLRNDQTRQIFRHPLIPKIFIWFNIVMVVIMAGFTLVGGSRPSDDPLQDFGNNPGMLITWLIWFPILPISAFLVGRIWCGVCPIAGISDILAKIKRFNLPAPKFLKRMDFWMVILSFIFLDYIEEFLGVAEKPWATGVLLVIIIGMSAVFCILFERKTFCRYLCPLAGMLGAYSTMSVVEVRGNKKICQTQCGQHSCFKGTDQAPGCPMFSYPASLTANSECMMCFNCIKSCDNRGVQVNLRPPLQEIWRQAQPLLSLSIFGVVLVGLMARHQFPHLAVCESLHQSLNWPDWMMHTMLYVVFVALAAIPFMLASTLSAAASQEKVSENMAHYGMAFIPLALSGHLSHIAHEVLGEGIYELLAYMVKLYHSVVAGIPIGTQEVVISPFIHTSIVGFVKFMMISGGMLGSLIALIMIARRFSERNVIGRILPHLMLLLFFWIGYLFIFLGPGPTAQTEAPAAPAAALQGPASATAEPGAPSNTAQALSGAPAATMSFSLSLPAIKNAAAARLGDPSVSQWIKSAQPVPGTGYYRLPLRGQVLGGPKGARVQVSLDTGVFYFQPLSPLDAQGNFQGDLYLTSLSGRIPLVFQLVDPVQNMVIAMHRLVIY